MHSLTWKNDTPGIIYWLRLDMSLGQVEVGKIWWGPQKLPHAVFGCCQPAKTVLVDSSRLFQKTNYAPCNNAKNVLNWFEEYDTMTFNRCGVNAVMEPLLPSVPLKLFWQVREQKIIYCYFTPDRIIPWERKSRQKNIRH